MELPPGGGNGGTVVPLPVSNASKIGVGSENQNIEGMVESNIDTEPEMYDFSSFLEGDIVDDIFPEFKEMLKAASLPRIGLVVPEMVEEVVANKNMEHHVQSPPSPPPTPPQHPKPSINSSTHVSGSLKWTKELHATFVDAIKQLGGAFIATPKTVRDIMNIEGLSLHQVKSHLQKYRIGKRLCNDWKKFYRRGSSFSRALGAPSKPTPSSQPPQAKNQRRRRAKPNKQENGSLQMKIQFQKHLQGLLEVQRQYAKVAASRMAANQTTGGYTSAANQNVGGYPFAANQNIGGHAFSLNQKMGGFALAGMKTYPENSFIREATMTPMQSCYPYQLNQYNGCISAAAIHAGIFIGQKPDKLQSIPVAYPHQQTQASFPDKAASGSYQQGFNSDAGESIGTTGISDEEFVESFLIDYNELTGDSQDNH